MSTTAKQHEVVSSVKDRISKLIAVQDVDA